jgi:16S rRNA (adenine1518-N6/adenine1519-N6)-dimethyltransferase
MPKKHLSQNFLYDPKILKRIIQIAGIVPEDTVVEIGPGPGRLTRLLAERAGRVIAVELDRDLFTRLRSETRDLGNLELVQGDALKYPYEDLGNSFKVVANIPYHITTPLIFRLMETKDMLRSMTLTVQKEVAERVAASPGSKAYGVLSVMVQYHGRARLKFVIPRGAFRPRPRVDSACLHVDISGSPTVAVKDEALFRRVVKTAFSQRRKTLRNSLKALAGDSEAALLQAGIDPSLRAETLSIQDFARLADILSGSRTLSIS